MNVNQISKKHVTLLISIIKFQKSASDLLIFKIKFQKCTSCLLIFFSFSKTGLVLTWIELKTVSKWMSLYKSPLYDLFWPLFCHMYVHLSQNQGSDGHFEGLNRSEPQLVQTLWHKTQMKWQTCGSYCTYQVLTLFFLLCGKNSFFGTFITHSPTKYLYSLSSMEAIKRDMNLACLIAKILFWWWWISKWSGHHNV